jgi:signal transduction histidine kinase/CheY-like chemotaxis protein
MSWPIVTLPIATEGDVVAARQRALQLAELLGFERQDQTRIATSVSEIARNAFSHARDGKVEFAVEPTGPRPIFTIRVSDRGKGIKNLDEILEGRSPARDGHGLGLAAAKRLMDRFHVNSELGRGTTVDLGHVLPLRAGKLTPAKIADITKRLTPIASGDALTVIHGQNRELMQSLEELKRRQNEADQLSRELSETNRGVVALYAELEARADQLREASELKSRFLSNISHEFRTPLNSILALTQLLLDNYDGPLTSEQEKQVVYVKRSAEGLLELVNDLLDLAKVEAGKVEVRPGRCSVPELFGTLRGALKPLQTNAHVELIFDSGDDVPELHTDEQKVAQILRNLISNALKFTEAGEVHVSATYDGETRRVTFAVRDTGIGIAAGDQQRIFEEFSQVDTRLHRRVKGTGLGLSLSRNLSKLLGGEIELESVVGQGSVFRLVIPAEIGGEAKEPQSARRKRRKRVLVIDDDETFRYVFRQLISGEPDYEVLDASDAEEGLKRARDERPELILLDLQMPQFDGFFVLREIEKEHALRTIPVVIATSLIITPQLRERLPKGIRVLSKSDITREKLSTVLREATEPPVTV